MDAAPISEPADLGGAPRLTLRIDLPNGAKLGHGKARLLELVAREGSISAAGRAMGMSYRRAWLLVDALNAMFRGPLVVSRAGGAGGGHAMLTADGEAVLRLYRAIEAEAAQAKALDALTRLLGDGAAAPDGATGNTAGHV